MHVQVKCTFHSNENENEKILPLTMRLWLSGIVGMNTCIVQASAVFDIDSSTRLKPQHNG